MQNIGDYTILVVTAGIYILAIFRFQTTPQLVVFATILFGFVYFLWGIVHHLRKHSFHLKIMLEYFLVALLGVAIITTLLV